MPYGVGDTVLLAKARVIADAAEPMATDFVAHGHESTFADDLRAHVNAFGEADVAKDTGMQAQAGATGGFEPLLDQAMTKVHQPDAFMQNFYKTNAAKMGEWHTASHVERQKKKKDDAPPTTPKA